VREDTLPETGEQELDGLGASAGEALREGVGAEQHGRADDLVRIRLADTACVAA
jgi:hypothetical protein